MATFRLIVWHLWCYITLMITKTKFCSEYVLVGDQSTQTEWNLHFERYLRFIRKSTSIIICILLQLIDLNNATLHIVISTLAFMLPRLETVKNMMTAQQ